MNPPVSAATGTEAGNPNGEIHQPPRLGVDHARVGGTSRPLVPAGLPARSLRPEIRNPLLRLPEFKRLRDLLHGTEPIAPTVFAEEFDKALNALRRTCAETAQHTWRKNKAPMAAYWKVAGVYVRHIARALR
jgi:hypothetical protein